ncbi:anti-sigma factor family protein [Nocardioides litoris]|uniref:anti-sigma factor family protein n=1 Tax=Nocardioides litoris TaxID=1926648 RepID=UPI0011207CBA|nr:zf-HC2 domain-containing protein [Nocardioides litoris]
MTARDPEHEKLRTDLGVYVLGALPPDEAAAVEAHLAGCAGCRAERDDLLPLADALGDLRRADGGPTRFEPTPDGLDDLVLARFTQERNRERRTAWARRTGLAAVAGAAAATALVVGLAVTRDDPAPAADPVPVEPVSVRVTDRTVAADAELVNHTWGVEVLLTGRGFVEGGAYEVAVVGTDGRRYPAGAFVGTGDREMLCHLNSAVLRPDADGFEVRDGRGRVVVSSRFS